MPQASQQSPSDNQGASGAVSDAQAKAAEAAGQAQEKAQQAAGQVQDRLRTQIDQRSSQAAGQIKQQASDLRSVGESLRQEGKAGPAKAADQLAQYAEKVGGYLQEKDSRGLLADAEDFGRRQPWAVAAGGLGLGFAASRFLKASSRQRYQSRPVRPAEPAAPTQGSDGYGSPLPPPPLVRGAGQVV
jgi:vacuolar-type H+-ATPase subunit H